MKYYAVKKEDIQVFILHWKDCQKEIDHFKDAKFQKLDSKKEALAYLKQNNQKKFITFKTRNNKSKKTK